MRLQISTFGIIWIISFGWWPYSFSVFRLRILDIESDFPGLITIFEIGAGGFVLSLDYFDETEEGKIWQQ